MDVYARGRIRVFRCIPGHEDRASMPGGFTDKKLGSGPFSSHCSKREWCDYRLPRCIVSPWQCVNPPSKYQLPLPKGGLIYLPRGDDKSGETISRTTRARQCWQRSGSYREAAGTLNSVIPAPQTRRQLPRGGKRKTPMATACRGSR